jgi:hypothetical protein
MTMVKTLVLVGMLAATATMEAAAQDRERTFEVGIRSALMMGTMDLSGLDPAFDDLESDGLKGAHMSGFFLMYRVRPHLRIGIETLVSNSDQTAATTMNYQAAGAVAELSYGSSWFIAGGVHAGGLIVNAMARQGPAPSEGASQGSFFKGEGLFLAPQVDVGYRFRRSELGLFIKQVNTFGEADRGGIAEFSSTFLGLRLAVGL